MRISVLTLVHNRESALKNTLDGIARGKTLPEEVVIVHMNEESYCLPDYPFAIKTIYCFENSGLNLAKARNHAILHSSNDYNIFLDVDCIPADDLLEKYVEAFNVRDSLWTGRVRYLSKGAMDFADWTDRLKAISTPDKVRGHLANFSYELFWSLNFGCSKRLFNRIGRFDEFYTGYGAEDTDFAFKARKHGVTLETLDATAYHQYHPSYSPPLNHLEEIVCNAMVFKRKWGVWPMEGWLLKFYEDRFIDWKDDHIRILRKPSERDMVLALSK